MFCILELLFELNIAHYFHQVCKAFTCSNLTRVVNKIGPIQITTADIQTLNSNVTKQEKTMLNKFLTDRGLGNWKVGWLNDQVCMTVFTYIIRHIHTVTTVLITLDII